MQVTENQQTEVE